MLSLSRQFTKLRQTMQRFLSTSRRSWPLGLDRAVEGAFWNGDRCPRSLSSFVGVGSSSSMKSTTWTRIEDEGISRGCASVACGVRSGITRGGQMRQRRQMSTSMLDNDIFSRSLSGFEGEAMMPSNIVGFGDRAFQVIMNDPQSREYHDLTFAPHSVPRTKLPIGERQSCATASSSSSTVHVPLGR